MKKFIISLFCITNLNVALCNEEVALTHKIFNELRDNNLEILDNYYHPDAFFVDPIGSHQGIADIKKYYGNVYQGVEEVSFEFKSEIGSNNKYFFPWVMKLKTPKLNDGKMFEVIGGSEIHFKDGLVIYHRDYFDMGEFIYERISVIGFIVKKIKERLKTK